MLSKPTRLYEKVMVQYKSTSSEMRGCGEYGIFIPNQILQSQFFAFYKTISSNSMESNKYPASSFHSTIYLHLHIYQIFTYNFEFLIIIMAKLIYTLLAFTLLLVFAVTQTLIKQEKGKTIIESNHYSSEDQVSANFSISNVELGKPLVIILKKKSKSSFNVEENHIKFTFHMGNVTETCTFTTYNNLCVINQVRDKSIKMTLECGKAPCEASWIIYQLQINPLAPGHLGQGLYSLEESNDHLVAYLSCNDPENKNFDNDVLLYSTSRFERGVSSNKIYFLFVNEEKGFIYVDIKEKSRSCAHLSISNVPKKLSYSRTLMKDFTNKHTSSVFQLPKPKSDFRLDCDLHKEDNSIFEKGATVKLKAINGNSTTILYSYTIQGQKDDRYIPFSITFKQPTGDYEYLELQFEGGEEKMAIVNFIISQAEVQEVELSEKNYFTLKKGEKILYQFLSDGNAQDKERAYFIPALNGNLTLNETNCSLKTGCSFQVLAKEDVSTHIYISSSPEASKKQLEYIPLVRTAKRKIKQGQVIYFRKLMTAHNAFEIAVNSPNILMYASSKEKCETPNSSCSERNGNYLHPFAYNPKQTGEFIIDVQALESSEFTLTVIEEGDEYIHLEDGFAFNYRIEQNEEEILFKYKLNQKIDVSFNLVAPLNHLSLVVFNGEELDELKATISSEGFVSFTKDEITSLNFLITVKKTELTRGKMTHFTLLATTSKTVVRLDPTVTHYQTILPATTREYIFEYDPSEQYIINFYTHNIKDKTINIMLSLSNDRVWTEKNLEKLYIDRESDYLDLKHASTILCSKEAQTSCEIFLLLKNEMDVEIDLTITLMTRNSIIELKDGLWQSYLENTIASEAYFFFYPKHIDKNVVIIYSTIMEDLRLAYTLWKTDSKSLNPAQWPFPKKSQLSNQSHITTVNHITIEKQFLKKECWPNCLVLLTLYRDPKIKFNQLSSQADFKIMASNNQIELPEKTRINLVLKDNEFKQIIVDLKYAIDKEYLTFYTTHPLGKFLLSANVISEKNARCPVLSQKNDFDLTHGETIIDVSKIKFKMRELNMQSDDSIYLCILVQAMSDGKFSIEYVSGKNEVQLIHLDSFQKIKLEANESKIYQIEGHYDFVVKIIRRSGYPYFFIKKCSTNTIKECKEETIASQEMGKQLAKKNEEFHEEPCEQCIYLIKFQTVEPAVVNLHLNTKNSETELKEHEIITDFISSREQSRYSMTYIQKKDLSVNIHIIEGDIIAKFTNYDKVSLVKQTEPNKKTIHFFIPKFYRKAETGQLKVNPFFGPFQYSSIFGSFHLIVKSKVPNATATFSITYSSGQNQIQLQDGLITDVVLEPNVPFKFFYSNQISNSHIHFTLSALDEAILSNLKLTSYYFQTEGEEENKVEFHMNLPTVRKKTPNPTLLLSLPEKNSFQIGLVNPSAKPEIVSLGINHQQLIILPFNHEFPFTLRPKEEINFLVDVSFVGFIQVQIRKCDESEPTVSFAFDHESFIKGEFQSQVELTDDPKFQDFLRVSKAGTFYINIKALDEPSILAINLKFFTEKPKTKLLKAGNRGLIQYQLTESKKAELSIAPVICESDCKQIKYYSMHSQRLEDLYSQLVCPSSFFSIDSMQTSENIPLRAIPAQQSSKVIIFSYELPQHTTYVAVKAITADGQEIYYKPVEIVTIWGHLSKTSQSYKITILCILIVSICALLLFVRHNARKGYRRVGSDLEESS